jgi:hypothetical protein
VISHRTVGEKKLVGKLTSFRTSNELRDRLIAAAKANGVSVNQEINDRVEASFDTPDVTEKAFANRGLYGLLRMLAVAMQISGRQAMTFKHSGDAESADEWLSDPYAYNQAASAAWKLLDACRPDGDTTAPTNTADPAWNALYASVGRNFAQNVLSEIALAAPGGRGEILRRDLAPTTLAQILKHCGVSK